MKVDMMTDAKLIPPSLLSWGSAYNTAAIGCCKILICDGVIKNRNSAFVFKI
jgi:hypothetical protein